MDAAAALSLYGGPAIVVDFGTATVFDAVSEGGEYLGGALAPGVSVAADALFHSTSQLRRVELVGPPTAIGKNTVHAMQSGLVFGYAEMVKGMVARFDDELGGGSKTIATGGFARVMEREVEDIRRGRPQPDPHRPPADPRDEHLMGNPAMRRREGDRYGQRSGR